MGPYIFERRITMNEEEKTLKEELKKNKNVIIAFVVGGIVGSILAKRKLRVAIKIARAEGYSTGVTDILKSILPGTK